MAAAHADAPGYASAFLEALQESLQANLEGVAQALADDAPLRAQVRAARQNQGDLHTLLTENLPAGAAFQAVVNLVTVLAEEDQLDLLPDIAADLQARLAGTAAPIKAQITSAVALTEAQQEALRRKLTAEHGQDLDIQFLIDDSLIGGLRIRVGDSLTDLSVSSSLQGLRDSVLASF